MKMPAFQFYPADWRKDPGVQALNRHDRSVWFDMLCIMHESDERGVLLLAGRPIPEDALARMLNLDNQTFNQTLTNILTYGVASRREGDEAIYCRRMVKDESLCQLRREAGKKGGNPNLVNQKPKQKPTTGDNQKPTPSSSTSSSTSSSEDEGQSSAAGKPEPLKASTPPRRLPAPPDDAQVFTPDNWMGLTNPATFASICTDLRLPIDLDRETYRAVIQDKMRSLKMEAIASTMRSWISGFFVNEKKKGPLLTLTLGLPTKPTPKAELPRPGQEQPGQVLAFEGESDDYVNRTRKGNYQRQWPAATIHIITPR